MSKSFLGIAIVVSIGLLIALAGSSDVGLLSSPNLLIAALVAFGLQWLAFIPAFIYHSERFYDLTGAATYIIITVFMAAQAPDSRALLLAALIILWAIRLGSFLFFRVCRAGSDSRFDKIKHSFPRFFLTWTLQGLWVIMTSAAGLAAMASSKTLPLGGIAMIGLLLWLIGFTIEVIADEQKRRFRLNPDNKDRFIASGLWAWSRHPNYFGEIVLWFGVAVIASPVLQGWQYVTLLSPVFVYFLLTKVSGIPLLEAGARKRWGGDAAFERYVATTSSLLLRPPRHD